MRYRFKQCLAVLLFCLIPATLLAAELSDYQKKELMLFGMKAMGLNVGISDVKKVLTMPEIEQMIAAGINLNGLLCAKITEIRPLKVQGAYEVTCIAYRGGTATKTYVIDSTKGTAFLP